MNPELFRRESRESYAGTTWVVRAITGRSPDRQYRCPGCQQMFSGGIGHVVVWPAEGIGGVEERRHWHASCWRARHGRPPMGSYR